MSRLVDTIRIARRIIRETRGVKFFVGVTLMDDMDEFEVRTIYAPTTKDGFLGMMKAVDELSDENPKFSIFFDEKTKKMFFYS